MPNFLHERQASPRPAVPQASLAPTGANGLPGALSRRGGAPARTYSSIERFAEVVGLLMKQPRTVSQLVEVLGIEGNTDHVYRYVNALHAEGVIYRCGWGGPRGTAPTYAWQPSVCAYVDAAKPERRSLARKAASTLDVARDLASKPVGIDE